MFLFVFHERVNKPFYVIRNEFVLYSRYQFIEFLYALYISWLIHIFFICIIPCNVGHLQSD